MDNKVWSLKKKKKDCDLLVNHDNNINVYNQHLKMEKNKNPQV